jgi:hypothetical protein
MEKNNMEKTMTTYTHFVFICLVLSVIFFAMSYQLDNYLLAIVSLFTMIVAGVFNFVDWKSRK